MTVIEELKDAIHKLHGVKATHVESAPIHEVFQGQTVWQGVVEVFHLEGHPKTDTAYGWLHDTGDPERPFLHVTVLKIKPALTPLAAVRAFIVQELKTNAEATEA